MGLFKDIKGFLTGETDTRCPKCGKSNLYLVDNPIEPPAPTTPLSPLSLF